MKHRPWWGLALGIAGFAPAASAKPIAPALFCDQAPEAPVCLGGQPACVLCHTTPPARNAYGTDLAAALLPGLPRPLSDADFAEGFAAAVEAVEGLDSDGDGFSNQDEILAGTYPAEASSVPVEAGCPKSAEDNGGYDVCRFDPLYVFRKIHLDVCGEVAPYDRQQAFLQLDDPEAELHATLDRCLDTDAWQGQDGALYRLAHRKIAPVQSIKSGVGAGDVPLGDYDDDYALFVYTQIDDHDARELLTADYFVEVQADSSPTYVPYVRSPFQDFLARGADVAQLVEQPRRAGMLTTRWNLALNTMFTPIPRTTAAQAYRAFLGLDIAKMEGLSEVPGEPADYDRKGVQAEACRGCHTTLDPLTYPFSRYAGFNGGLPFSYVPDRVQNLAAGADDPLNDTPEAGVLFGQRVENLNEWGQVAANSEAFARATVADYWKLLTGEMPRPTEQVEFEALVTAFRETHNYRVEAMLHDLIMTEAYGVP